jgi:hypothetical protein
MEKHIYKFLDTLVGNQVVCCKSLDLRHRGTLYKIKSTDGTLILEFNIFEDKTIGVFRSRELCDTVSAFFNIDDQEAANYIKWWFGDVHGLKKVGDILKFI